MSFFNYPARLPLAQTPTPLHKLERLSDQVGVNVWIKRDDLTGHLLSGNKIRKLEFSLAEAQRQGCDAVITCGGLQSNHCRATALAAAQLGMKSALILRGHSPGELDGNLLLDTLSGAEISVVKPSVYTLQLDSLLQEKAEELSARGLKPFVIPTGASDELGLWGYIAAAEEINNDLGRIKLNPSHLVCATGSGGTHAGLALGFSILRPELNVLGVAVCDDESYFTDKAEQDIGRWRHRYPDAVSVDFTPESVSIQVNDQYIGPGYGRADDEVFEVIKMLASLEGIVLDPVYTGKAFYGLLKEIEAGLCAPGSDVLFVHTGGLFGLFPFADRLGQNPKT